ncbi:MAG: three-Cys-motif partner protein TcmP [Cyanobacteria bacterium P01_A01_bin.84]
MVQQFGGNWTENKLDKIRKYLPAYVHVLKDKGLEYFYIDAFAGTGYRELKNKKSQEGKNQALLTQKFLDGSARIALQTEPPFNKYIFIEKKRNKIAELEKLKQEFPGKSQDIEIVNDDANSYLIGLCKKDWRLNRAVLFLDPFGMQIPWSTIEAIAKTHAIDLWYLFPLGVAVNRLLKTDANISEACRKKLDEIFGTNDWFEAFYKPQQARQLSLFDINNSLKEQVEKVANFESISQYFVERLKTVFAGVAENPLLLRNSCNNPLYLLCFASGNPRGSKTAIKIAQHILKN